jgi:hypothetical protein
MSTSRLTLPSSPCSFWRNTKWLSSPTHRTPLIWHFVISFYFQKWNWSWKKFGLIPLCRSRPNRIECWTLKEKDFQEVFKNGGESGIGVYMRKGTTSRVMAADRPYGEFYDLYSVSPEYFGNHHVGHVRSSPNVTYILSNSDQISSLSADFHKSHHYQISRKSIQWEPRW